MTPSELQDQCETCNHFNDAREDYDLCALGYEIFTECGDRKNDAGEVEFDG